LKDTGKEIYNDIAEGGYGEWLDVGVNGVRWGEGDGGVWVFTDRASLDEIAWEVLKMSFERMEKLYVRNIKVLRRKLKPILLPEHVHTLITTREKERQGRLDADLKMAAQCYVTDEAVAEVARLRHACYAGKAKITDLLADHRDFCAKEESLKEQTRLEMVELRNVRDQAVSALHSQAEKNALIVNSESVIKTC